MRKYWTDAELARLKAFYPDVPAAKLAKAMGRSVRSVYAMANICGLHKSEAFLNSPLSGRVRPGQGGKTKFPKGNIPWNAGMKGWKPKGSEKGHFKKGQMPHNHKPVGSTRISKDGYMEVKVKEPKKWRAVHVLEWEKHNGKVPRGYIVVFKGDKLNTDISNLELITRAENMRRNSHYNKYPPEISRLIQLRGAFNRQINQRAEA